MHDAFYRRMASGADLRSRPPFTVPILSRATRALLTVATCALLLSCPSVAGKGGAPPAAAGGGGSSPSAGPSIISMPIPSAFRTFYIVADGSDANFQTYASTLTAKYFGLAFQHWQGSPSPLGYVYYASAPGWTQDTLTTACSKDGNVVGGLVIKFASYYTDAYWILYNAETQHVTPSFIYISCWRGIPIQAAPAIGLETQKSGPEITIPIGPITGLAT